MHRALRPSSERVPAWRKAAYGLGGLTDFLYPNTVNALAIPIYSIALGMDPLLLGVAMAVPRISERSRIRLRGLFRTILERAGADGGRSLSVVQ